MEVKMDEIKIKLEVYLEVLRLLKECSPEVIKPIIEGRIEAYQIIMRKKNEKRNIL